MDNRKADNRKSANGKTDSRKKDSKTKENNKIKAFCAKSKESEKLIIEGNAFYEIDLECIREKQRRSKYSK